MRSPIYEAELTRQGVTWTYVERQPLHDIDARKGLANQARLLEPLPEHLWKQYEDMYRQDAKEGVESKAPPLVLHRPGNGRANILDGNNRLKGATEAGLKFHDAYFVACKDELILNRIAWSFNNKVNGARLSREESLQHAVDFVRKYGITMKEAAKEWGVPETSISKNVRVLNMRDTLEKNKVSAKNLSDDQLYRMSPLETLGEDVFIPAAKAIAGTGATLTDVEDLTKRVKGAKTHADKLVEIAAFESSDKIQARRAETKNGTVKRPSPLPRERLRRLVGEAVRLLDGYEDKKAFMPPSREEKKAFMHEASDLVQKLIRIFGLATVPQLEETA